jgi:hypothetical protein
MGARFVKKLLFSAILMSAAAMSACVGPRVVVQMEPGKGETMKFVYNQDRFFSVENGILKCELAELGKVKSCEKVNVTWVEE